MLIDHLILIREQADCVSIDAQKWPSIVIQVVSFAFGHLGGHLLEFFDAGVATPKNFSCSNYNGIFVSFIGCVITWNL